MHFQFVVGPPATGLPTQAPMPPDESTPLLRELIQIQREQLALLHATQLHKQQNARWQALLERWSAEFPEIGLSCQSALPQVERAFLGLIEDMTSYLLENDRADSLDEFTLAEFLDRYGSRIGQLGTLLNVLGPISEAARSKQQ